MIYPRPNRPRRQPANQAGFTIIELMIALSVISGILILSTSVILSLGGIYTKGIYQTNTQNVARNIINEIAGQLQLGGATPIIITSSPTKGSFCLGSQRYSYVLNNKLDGGTSSDHVLWRDTLTNSSSCMALTIEGIANPTDSLTNPAIKGSELLSANMRLTPPFGVTDNSNGTYTIRVTVAYGDDDVLRTLSGRTLCTSEEGKQYCAVSSLVQTVAKRESN